MRKSKKAKIAKLLEVKPTKRDTDLSEIVRQELDYSKTITEERSPQGLAVESLINVKEQVQDSLATDIELKTDLDDSEIKLHTAVELMGSVLSLSPGELQKKNIILELVMKLERKALSKARASRTEIVEIARAPDMSFPGMGGGMGDIPRRSGGIRGLFRSRRQ